MAEEKEINQLPKDWELKTFEDVLDYVQPTAFIVESDEYNDSYEVPVLTAGKSFIKGYTNETNGIFKALPVIIFDDFTTANKFVNFPFKVKSSAMKILKPKDENVNIKFVFYYMQTVRVSFDTHKRYWISVFSKLPLPYPPPATQLAIVAKIEELFSEIENGIKSLFTAKEQLKKYRQSVLKWAFEGKLTNGLNYDLPDEHDLSVAAEPETEYRVERNHNNQKNQKNHSSDKGKLPEGWKWVKISSLCKVVRGGSPRPAGDPKYYDGNIPFLKVADLTKDNGMFLTTFKYTIKEAGLHKTRQIKPNTLLLSNSGATLGVPKICMINATMNDGVAAFLELDEKTNQYLYYFWLSKTRELRNINMGAAQPNLNTDIIRDYPVPYCSFEEQKNVVQAIESRLSVADKMEESITESLQQAEALKQSILKKAFQGRLI